MKNQGHLLYMGQIKVTYLNSQHRSGRQEVWGHGGLTPLQGTKGLSLFLVSYDENNPETEITRDSHDPEKFQILQLVHLDNLCYT